MAASQDDDSVASASGPEHPRAFTRILNKVGARNRRPFQPGELNDVSCQMSWTPLAACRHIRRFHSRLTATSGLVSPDFLMREVDRLGERSDFRISHVENERGSSRNRSKFESRMMKGGMSSEDFAGAQKGRNLDLIRAILDGTEGDAMPRQRYQDPKIQIRTDVKRPFYFIRPYVPVVDATGVKRKKHSIPLGFVNEISVREAKARKQQIMATINAGKFVFQSQIPFREVVQRFLDLHVPTLGSATRENYQTQIRNHILPSFGDLRLCDITRTMVATWLNAKASAHDVTIRLPDGSETRERISITRGCAR